MADSVMTANREPASDTLAPGTRVDVRNRFVGGWSHGFEIADHGEDGYVIKRLSDDSILNDVFSEDDVRPELHKRGWWWY